MSSTPNASQSLSLSDTSLGRLPVGGHGARLLKKGAKIDKLANEIFNPIDVVADRGDDESDSDSESDCYASDMEKSRTRYCSDWNEKKEKDRIKRLLKKMNIEKREKMLKTVQNDMRLKAVTSKRDQEELSVLERKHEKTFKQVEGVAQEVLKDVVSHEQRTLDSMQQFQESMKIMKGTRKSKLFTGLFKDVKFDVEKMTDEEVIREMDILRAELLVKERDALHVMSEIARGNADLQTLDPADDVNEQQEKMLANMREAIKYNERRAKSLREIADHLNGKAVIAEDDEMLTLSPEAASVLKEVTAATHDQLLPDLLAQRHAQHGDELRPVDDAYLKKVLKQCEIFASGQLDAEVVKDRFAKIGAFDEDMDAKLQAANRLEMPVQVMLDSSLEALREVFSPAGDDSDDEFEEETYSVKLGYVHDVNEELKMDIRASKEHQREVLVTLIDAIKKERDAQMEYERCDSLSKALRKTLDTMNDNQTLFVDALALARGLAPTGAISEPERRPADPNESPLVAAAVVGAVGSCKNRSGVDVNDEHLWTEAFLVEMGDTLDDDTFQIQSEIINALKDEEGQLTREIQELEVGLGRQVTHFSDLLQGSPHQGALEELGRVTQETQQLLGELGQSRNCIACCGSEEVLRLASQKDAASTTLVARRKAVKTARALQGSLLDTASGGYRTTLLETLKLQDQNADLMKQIRHIEGELNWRRSQYEALKEKRSGRLKVPRPELDGLASGLAAARQLRRETRQTGVMRAEIKSLNSVITMDRKKRDSVL